MTRWNIRAVLLYSHDERRRELVFDLGTVNIITGQSHTGKSAIAEVIDYAMGAGECHLPGLVHEASSWVALLWQRGNDRFAVARRVPKPGESVANEMFWRKGSTTGAELLPLSASGFTSLESRETVLRQIEQAFGIGDVVGETLNSNRPGSRISARHVVPYLLQDDDVIINKLILLRGLQDQRRQHIIESLPYFLRVTNESSAALEAEVRRLRTELRAEERRAKELQDTLYAEQDRARALLAETAQVGLVTLPVGDVTLDQAILLLETTRDWEPGAGTTSETDQLTRLHDEEENLRSTVSRLRGEIRASERLLEAAIDFDGVVRDQTRKLSYVAVFRDQSEKKTCPICASDVASMVPTIATLQQAHNVLSAELASVTRDRPKLDDYLREKRDNLAQAADRLAGIRRALAELVAENDAVQNVAELDNRRSRVAGRVSFYLDSRQQFERASPAKLEDLRRRLSELEVNVDEDAKRERLEIEQQVVAKYATEILEQLPFDDQYRDAAVYFLARKIECGIVTPRRRMSMRGVGSDENYLSLHVAILTALHRHFKLHESPVPGVLLFDQISRPYYPPEEYEEEIVLEETEGGRIKRYFDFLFDEVKGQGDLQVIVLEHAYFRSDARFAAATKHRWSKNGERLIPSDWPRT
jgi:Protein of unknown function (DUF3732)